MGRVFGRVGTAFNGGGEGGAGAEEKAEEIEGGCGLGSVRCEFVQWGTGGDERFVELAFMLVEVKVLCCVQVSNLVGCR